MEHYMNIYKLETFINNEHHRNVINMTLGTLHEHYECVFGTLHQEDLKIFITEKHLEHTKHYEHVLKGMHVSNILSMKITLRNL